MATECILSTYSRRVRVYDPIAVSSPSQRFSLRGRSPSGAEPEPAADWIIKPFPQRPLRLGGETWFLDWPIAIQKANKINSILQEFYPIWTAV